MSGIMEGTDELTGGGKNADGLEETASTWRGGRARVREAIEQDMVGQ